MGGAEKPLIHVNPNRKHTKKTICTFHSEKDSRYPSFLLRIPEGCTLPQLCVILFIQHGKAPF